jgi:hypothetical protein
MLQNRQLLQLESVPMLVVSQLQSELTYILRLKRGSKWLLANFYTDMSFIHIFIFITVS